jgi:hypothetical protein
MQVVLFVRKVKVLVRRKDYSFIHNLIHFIALIAPKHGQHIHGSSMSVI